MRLATGSRPPGGPASGPGWKRSLRAFRARSARFFHDLLDLELDLRIQTGEQPDRRHYHGMFPEHEDIIGAVFAARDGLAASRTKVRIPSL